MLRPSPPYNSRLEPSDPRRGRLLGPRRAGASRRLNRRVVSRMFESSRVRWTIVGLVSVAMALGVAGLVYRPLWPFGVLLAIAVGIGRIVTLFNWPRGGPERRTPKK